MIALFVASRQSVCVLQSPYLSLSITKYFLLLYSSGGFGAAVTTPLDVAKTRVMLAPV